jgi:chaperonin GroEL (HSP60 family)
VESFEVTEYVHATLTDKDDSRIATIVVRGSTANIMDDVERAIDDAVNSYKSLTKDSRFLPGAGATEIELAKQLTSFGEVCCVVCKGVGLVKGWG